MVAIQNNQKISEQTAIVIGGGIAGIYSAILLQEKGYKVSLIERRKFLGGRTYSVKQSSNKSYDNGQHLLMGCYDKFLQLLTKIDSLSGVNFQDSFSVKIADKRGKTGIIRDTKYIPYGFMLLVSLLKYHYEHFQNQLNFPIIYHQHYLQIFSLLPLLFIQNSITNCLNC